MEADGAVHLDAVDAGPGRADGFRRGRGEALADEEAFDAGFGLVVGFDLDFGEAEEVGLDFRGGQRVHVLDEGWRHAAGLGGAVPTPLVHAERAGDHLAAADFVERFRGERGEEEGLDDVAV